MLYLVTAGTGEDGNEWRVEGIFTTRELAEAFVVKLLKGRDWASSYDYSIEAWTTDPEEPD